MNYRYSTKNGDKLSVLGFGCMRFGRDEDEVTRLIEYAIGYGINYFDTAYIYPGSESMLGRVLTRLKSRNKVNIATKLPPYLVNKPGDAERIFRSQLEHLQTDRIDYYLMHMLPGIENWERLLRFGIHEWLQEKKRTGQIRNVGFSYHGGTDGFIKLIDAYDWDFSMIQYNYMDEHSQAGRKGLAHASSKGMPVMIMEPLRGGRLAAMRPPEAMAVWSSAEIRRSPAEWSFKWLWNQPEVTTVLSGMNNFEAVKENIRAASENTYDIMTKEELGLYDRVREVIRSKTLVPCTGCRYCVPCPRGVDIPACFDNYNATTEDFIKSRMFYILQTNNHNAGLCVGCGKCETHCPQHIKIRQELENVRRVMEGVHYRPSRFLIRKFMNLHSQD